MSYYLAYAVLKLGLREDFKVKIKNISLESS